MALPHEPVGLEVQPMIEEDDQDRGDAEERAKRKLVASGNGPAESGDFAKAAPVPAKRDLRLPATYEKADDEKQSDDAAKKGAEQQSEERSLNTEEGADHEHHFDIAQAHALASANEFIERGGGEQKQTARRSAQERARNAEQGRIAFEHCKTV